MANKQLWNSGSINQENVHQVSSAPRGVDPAQWEANPYANIDYNQSPFQKLLANLGFRTNYDAYRESMALQAKEYEANLLDKAHNEEFDSALAQAQRERAAGMNPDLTGNVDAGSSSSLSDDGNPPIAPEGSDGSILMNVAGGLFSCVETLMGLMESGYGLASMAQDVRGKSLANDRSQMENSLEAFLGVSLPIGNKGDNSDGSNWHFRFGFDNDSRLARLLGSSRKAKKYYRAVNLFRDSLLGQETEKEHQYGRAKNRALFSGLKGRSTYSEFDDVLDAFEGAISDIALDAEMTNLQKDTASNVYETEKIQYMDAERMAGAEMLGAEGSAAVSQAEAGKLGSERKMLDARIEAKNSLDTLSKHLDGMKGFGAELGKILVDLLKVRVFQL